MIFYLATDDAGLRQLRGTQADAGKINKHFEQLDIPVDKAGLMMFVQDLFTQIDLLAQLDEPASSMLLGCIDIYEPTPTPAPMTKIDLLTRQQIEERWTEFPLAWRLDMHHVDLEEARQLAQR